MRRFLKLTGCILGVYSPNQNSLQCPRGRTTYLNKAEIPVMLEQIRTGETKVVEHGHQSRNVPKVIETIFTVHNLETLHDVPEAHKLLKHS